MWRTYQHDSAAQTAHTHMTAHILCVDADDHSRHLIAELLYEHEVDFALTADDAVELAHYHSYDLYFVDPEVPGYTGPQLLDALRFYDPDAPLIICAAAAVADGLPDLAFAAARGGRRLELVRGRPTPHRSGDGGKTPVPALPVPAEADFVISGWIDPTRTKPEGPFGDHLGYYSLTHDFPVMTVEAVHHRPGAIWPFTVVGRPPQEDTTFGELIHELTGPVIPTVIPGVHAVHAVDAAGVHPLLLAVGSERYVPYARERRPQELLTLANAILGQGQLSLAKYLLIVAKEDCPGLDVHDTAAFLRHLLERFDPESDLHFQTRTTADTLDYSPGMGLNAGSKLVLAAAGPKRRELATAVAPELALPDGFSDPRVALPGVLTIKGPPIQKAGSRFQLDDADVTWLCSQLAQQGARLDGFPLVVVADDSDFVSRTLNNFLWAVFTRSDPANDVYGVGAFTHRKHWGCRGAVVIDARLKPHMPPPLEVPPEVTRKVDPLFAKGGPLAGVEK